ncbi:MAG: PilZ domain-containing protein [Pseudomonadota bacterium]
MTGESNVAHLQERRRFERYEVVQAIFIEVVNPGSRRESENCILRCETVDVSKQGLRIFSNEFIEPGTKLNIAVPQEGWVENLELAGESRWTTPAEGRSGYWVGLELQDTSRDNMAKWFKIVSQLR